MSELWRDIPGYEGIYQASDDGQVRSLDRVVVQRDRWDNQTARRLRGALKTPTVDRGKWAYGRLQVKLSKGDKATTLLVHRIVMETFVGPCPAGFEVAHNDGNTKNCALDNLRYATPLENTRDKIGHGTHLVGAECGSAKLTPEAVAQIRAFRRAEPLQATGARFGISSAQVSRIQNFRQWRDQSGGEL